MAINIRKVGEVADGAVTFAKLADNAVVLESSKVTGELPSDKLADSAVIESKLANLAISTGKLQDNVVTLAKANNDIRVSHFAGDESEVSITGTTEVSVKELGFVKNALYNCTDVRFIAAMKTSDVSYTATLKVYIDAEGTERLSLTSTATDYELKSGTFDVSDLTNGKHSMIIKLASSDAAGTAYNELVDVLVVKG